MRGLPITEHPQASKYWDRYVNAFNPLAEKLDKLKESGVTDITIEELSEVVEAACDIERLGFLQFLQTGISMLRQKKAAEASSNNVSP